MWKTGLHSSELQQGGYDLCRRADLWNAASDLSEDVKGDTTCVSILKTRVKLSQQTQCCITPDAAHFLHCLLMFLSFKQLKLHGQAKRMNRSDKDLQCHSANFFLFYASRGAFLNGIIEMTLQRDQDFNVRFKTMHVTFTLIINRL